MNQKRPIMLEIYRSRKEWAEMSRARERMTDCEIASALAYPPCARGMNPFFDPFTYLIKVRGRVRGTEVTGTELFPWIIGDAKT